jgi:hypothetical protein
MAHDASGITRHALLARAFGLLVGLSVVAMLGRSREVRAAKATKEDFGYRGSPKDGKRCASCRLFSPTASGEGTCAAIEGVVSADGWCEAYSPRGQASGPRMPADQVPFAPALDRFGRGELDGPPTC